MIIQHNLLAGNAKRQSNTSGARRKKATERLSSGYSINRAADDAAGLSISEKMRGQIRGLTRASQNVQDGISLCQTADGALSEVTDMLHRISELSIEAANTGVNCVEDREAIQKEVNQLLKAIDRVADDTEYNGIPIFSVGGTTLGFQRIYEDVKQSLLNGTYRQVDEDTIPNCLRDLNHDYDLATECDDINDIIRYMSNTAITIDLCTSFLQNIDAGESDETISTEFNDKFESYLPLLLSNSQKNIPAENEYALGDFARERYINGLTALSQGDYDEAGSYFRTAVQTARDMNNTAASHNASGLLALMGLRSAQNGITRENYDMTVNRAIHYTMSAIVDTLKYSNDIFQFSSEEPRPTWSNQIKSATLPKLNNLTFLVYNTSFSSEGIWTGLNGTKVDIMDRVVLAYMSMFDDLKDITPDMLDGEIEENGLWIQAGANEGQGIRLDLEYLDTGIIGVRGINVTTDSGAQDAISRSHNAVTHVTEMRSKFGAYQNRLEHAYSVDQNTAENTQAAESRIRDTDMAKEMMEYAKSDILNNAAQAMIAQANRQPEGVLKILS